MSITSVFTNNRSQAVRLTADVRLPDGVKKVQVRARGVERIISPVGQRWEEFFLGGPPALSRRAKVGQNLAVVGGFASLLEVLPYSARASQHYGAIRCALERSGRPIGADDLHIAHARSEGLTLVTSNLGAFERVPGLLTENWIDASR